ncbi:major facilitator superfamily domain-containing protein [Trichoderma austrokoningii]
MINRFFAGFFGVGFLTISGAVCADLFDNRTRGLAITVFTLCVFIAPMFAPFVGGFVLASHLGWRWTQYIAGIMCALAIFLNAIHSKLGEAEVNLKDVLSRYFLRPLHMIVVEPIVLLMRYVVYQMRPGVSGLSELSAVVGCAVTLPVMILRAPRYRRKLEVNDGVAIPEWRLSEAMVSGVFFAGGLFWLGWSGFRAVTGFGIYLVFLQQFNHLIYANTMMTSALTGNVFLRSIFGAVFPLFAPYMYRGTGIQWSLTLLGCVTVLLALVPFVLHFKGAQIRRIQQVYSKRQPAA